MYYAPFVSAKSSASSIGGRPRPQCSRQYRWRSWEELVPLANSRQPNIWSAETRRKDGDAGASRKGWRQFSWSLWENDRSSLGGRWESAQSSLGGRWESARSLPVAFGRVLRAFPVSMETLYDPANAASRSRSSTIGSSGSASASSGLPVDSLQLAGTSSENGR